MKRLGLIQKRDIVLVCILLLVGIFMSLWLVFFHKIGNRVIVSQGGEILYELSLKENGTYRIEEGSFYNELVIVDGVAYMKDANCRDLVCVHQGPIFKVNETITCLPHKLIVYVVGDDISEMDAVVN